MIKLIHLLPLAALLCGASVTHAQNKGGGGSTTPVGVITIDQAKAEAGGVTPGDAPGFPVTLSQPGSYRLMGALAVPANTDGIVITAKNVTIDLNGFTVAGPLQCSGSQPDMVSCNDPTLTMGSGIVADQVGGTVLRNGRIEGFVQRGLFLGNHARIDRVDVAHVRHGAIAVGNGALLTDCGVSMVYGTGLFASSVTVRGCEFRLARVTGIELMSGGGSILDSRFYRNGTAVRGTDAIGRVLLGRNAFESNTSNISGSWVAADGNLCGTVACQ
jgi:hypothetical protein